MTFTYGQPVDSITGRTQYQYELRDHDRNTIRAFMLGEDRRDAEGNLVEWDMILVSRNLYVWRRSEWPVSSSTKPLERCRQ